jgi:hypothetical protein
MKALRKTTKRFSQCETDAVSAELNISANIETYDVSQFSELYPKYFNPVYFFTSCLPNLGIL